MLEAPGFFGSVNKEILWWKDKALELSQRCQELEEKIQSLESLAEALRSRREYP